MYSGGRGDRASHWTCHREKNCSLSFFPGFPGWKIECFTEMVKMERGVTLGWGGCRYQLLYFQGPLVTRTDISSPKKGECGVEEIGLRWKCKYEHHQHTAATKALKLDNSARGS